MSIRADTTETIAALTPAYDAIAEAVCERVAKNQPVRRNLPGGGRLRIDRQLPFLCLYRGRDNTPDDVAHKLVTSEAAYLFASDQSAHDQGLARLVDAVGDEMQEHFGTFLVIKVSIDNDLASDFEIAASDADSMPSTLAALETELSSIRVDKRLASVARCGVCLDPVSIPNCGGATCCIGLKIRPFFRDPASGMVYPLVLQRLRQQLARAFRKTVDSFTGGSDEAPRSHYQTFGPSSLVKAARLIDQQLCEVSEQFDYLLQVTPVNGDEAWQRFRESDYRELPPLQYRHLPFHPNLLKRRLFAIEIERVEDPTLAYLFWEKQDEIDRQLTSLRDLHLPEMTVGDHPGQSNFLSSSLQLYGGPEDSLVELAKEILARLAKSRRPRSRRDVQWEGETQVSTSSANPRVSCDQFVACAREEIDYYHTQMSEFSAKVEVSDQIASSIMVSRDRLLVADSLQISAARVAPLLHHEVGTHLLTYFNGRCQPLRQLHTGLAGYEELQEGLAVLAEYLVGGLTDNRMRTLAARVMAVHWMVQGMPFAGVFRRLRKRHELSKRQAFSTALRVFRGGGLTKDLIYLRGLHDLLDYLAGGHGIEPLYVGKIGLQHVPYIQELRRRGIITAPKILPRFWHDPKIRQRLDVLRGQSVLDLVA